jgi:Spy/CpxP family protein refolding chaperone
MKRFRTLSISLALSALALLATASVNAQPGPPGSAPDPISIYREAGATPDQLQKIRDLAKEFEQVATVKGERFKNLTKKMQELSLQPSPDEKVVLGTQDEINALMAEMANSRIKVMLKIRTILSDDQRNKLVDIMKQRAQGPGPQ